MGYNEELSRALNKLAQSEKHKVPEKKTVVNTRLDSESLKNVDAYAKASGQSRSKAISDLIDKGFKYIIEHQKE